MEEDQPRTAETACRRREGVENRAAVVVLPGPLANVEPVVPGDLGEPEFSRSLIDTPRSALATTKPILTSVLAAVWIASAARPMPCQQGPTRRCGFPSRGWVRFARRSPSDGPIRRRHATRYNGWQNWETRDASSRQHEAGGNLPGLRGPAVQGDSQPERKACQPTAPLQPRLLNQRPW